MFHCWIDGYWGSAALAHLFYIGLETETKPPLKHDKGFFIGKYVVLMVDGVETKHVCSYGERCSHKPLQEVLWPQFREEIQRLVTSSPKS
jgi:hypothetical protein